MNEKKTFWSDPLRHTMLAGIGGKSLWMLASALCCAFVLAVFASCRTLEGGMIVSLAAGATGVLMILYMAKSLDGRNVPAALFLCGACLMMLSVAAQLSLLSVKPGRFTNTLAPLMDDMWNYELVSALAWEDDFWSGGYLLVCGLLSRVENFSRLYAIKLIDLVCMGGCVCAAAKIAKLRGAKPLGIVVTMGLCALAPTVLLNTGLWAQCDAVFAMFALWGLALLLDDHPAWGCLLWGVAVGFKLQSAFLFPLLLVLFMDRRVSLRHLLLILAAFVLVNIAIPLDGQEFGSMFTRYAGQLENARADIELTDQAAGVYGLLTNASVREYSGMGLYFGIACALLTVCAMLRGGARLSNRAYLLGALLLAVGLPVVLPQMNARCYFLAGLLAFAVADSLALGVVAAMLEWISLCCYIASIFSAEVLPLTVLSLLAIAAAVIVAVCLVAELRASRAEEAA